MVKEAKEDKVMTMTITYLTENKLDDVKANELLPIYVRIIK